MIHLVLFQLILSETNLPLLKRTIFFLQKFQANKMSCPIKNCGHRQRFEIIQMQLSIQREIQFCQNKEIHSSFTKQILHVVSRGKLWSLPEVRHIWSQVERWRQGLPLKFQLIFFNKQTNKSHRTELSVLKFT